MSGGVIKAINPSTVGGIQNNSSNVGTSKENGDFHGMTSSQTNASDNTSKTYSMVSIEKLATVHKFDKTSNSEGGVKAWFKENMPKTCAFFTKEGFKDACKSAWNTARSFGSSMLQGLREAAAPVAAKFDAAENDQPIELKSAKDESALIAKLDENLSRQAEIQERLDKIQAARDKAYGAYEDFKNAYINGSKSNAEGSEGSSVVAKHVNDDQIEPEGNETFAVPLNGELNDEDALYIAQEYSKQEQKKFEAMEGNKPKNDDENAFQLNLNNSDEVNDLLLNDVIKDMTANNMKGKDPDLDENGNLYGLTVEQIAGMTKSELEAARDLWKLQEI